MLMIVNRLKFSLIILYEVYIFITWKNARKN